MGSIPKDLAGGANSFLVVLTLLEKGKNTKMTKLLPIKAYPFTRKQRAIIRCQKRRRSVLKCTRIEEIHISLRLALTDQCLQLRVTNIKGRANTKTYRCDSLSGSGYKMLFPYITI